MSSFVIPKKDYVKCAGFIAGITDFLNRGNGLDHFWLYDTVAKKNTDKDLFYTRFCQVYRMNAESVQQQYGDKAAENDTASYKTDFESFYRKGYKLMMAGRDEQMQALADIRQFLHGSLYQIENEKYEFMVSKWFCAILDQLTLNIALRGYESECWGEFNLTVESEKTTTA